MERRLVKCGRIFHPYPCPQMYTSLIDWWKENNHSTSHSERWVESSHINPILQNQDTESKYIASDSKLDSITRNETLKPKTAKVSQ